MTGVWATVAIGVQKKTRTHLLLLSGGMHGRTHRVDFDQCIAPATTSSSGVHHVFPSYMCDE
jgi:hypothetical protein